MGDLAGICPVLDVFNIDDGTLNDDEDLVIEDLKGAIDSTIKTVREYNNGRIWSFGFSQIHTTRSTKRASQFLRHGIRELTCILSISEAR